MLGPFGRASPAGGPHRVASPSRAQRLLTHNQRWQRPMVVPMTAARSVRCSTSVRSQGLLAASILEVAFGPAGRPAEAGAAQHCQRVSSTVWRRWSCSCSTSARLKGPLLMSSREAGPHRPRRHCSAVVAAQHRRRSQASAAATPSCSYSICSPDPRPHWEGEWGAAQQWCQSINRGVGAASACSPGVMRVRSRRAVRMVAEAVR